MAQPGSFQASNNSGELSPELHGRVDIKQFYAGLSYALNVEPAAQGGSRLSPRTRHLGRIRRGMSVVAASSSTLTLGPHAEAAIVAILTYGTTVEFSAVRLTGFGCDVAIDGLLQVEYLVGDDWLAFGDPFGISTLTAAGRMVALPPSEKVQGAAIRLRLTGAPSAAATFLLTAMTALVEGGDLSPVRLKPFTFELGQTYVSVLTDDHADFWRDGTYVGGVRSAVAADQIAVLDVQQRFDTMLLFHPDIASKRILRDGADNQWIRDDLPFTGIPQVDLGGTYENAVADKWNIYIRYPTSGTYANGANLFLSISVNGEETAGIPTGSSPNWTTFAAAVKTALEGLPSIEPGLTVTESHTSGLTTLTVEFTGEDNEGSLNSMTAQVVNTADAAATVTHVQIGVPGGEALISDQRGYAACAGFYQDRLVTGGFKAKKGALLASNTSDYFNLNTDVAAASGAILANLDTDGAEEIQKISRARHLIIFTSDAEYFISDRVLSRTAIPTVVNSSRNGSARGVPIVASEDTLLYFSPQKESDDRSGIMLYSMSYDDVAQAYVSTPISLLASHIVTGIVDAALQKGSQASDANRHWGVRNDGTMVIGVMIRNQDVTAFVRWATEGDVKAVCVDGKNRTHIAVERMVDGEPELHLERLELGLIFDGTVEQSFDEPTATITGLDMHEGASVWAQADGHVIGPFTVAGGAITLPVAASQVSVGRWTPPVARTLPIPRVVQERVEQRRPIRVHTVTVDVLNTTSIAVGANGGAAEDLPLYFSGDEMDLPPQPYSGPVTRDGIDDFSDDGIVEITQVRPGALQWRKFTVEARF